MVSESFNNTNNFVLEFFNELNKENIKYAILRKYENIYVNEFNDIDFCIEKNKLKETFSVLKRLCNYYGWFVFNTIYKDGLVAIHLYKIVDNKVEIVHLDIFEDINWKGLTVLTNNELLNNVLIYKDLNIISKDNEAVICLLSRFLYHGNIKEEYKDFIHSNFILNKEKILITLENLFGKRLSKEIYNNCISKEWEVLENNVINVRKKIVQKSIFNLKNNLLFMKSKWIINNFKRISNRKGIFITFLGTDGSGKSTVIENIQNQLFQSYPKSSISYFHWRPKLILNEKKENIIKSNSENPHEKPPHNRIKSFIKFMIFNLDYIFGYFLLIYPKLVKNHMVIFDRYYYDYFIDINRYRMDIDERWIIFANKFIPKPDVTFLLVGDPITIYNRKKEIPLNEIESQISKLKENKNYFNNNKIIDVNNSIEKVTIEVCNELLQSLQRKELA
ncbi:hypothetical protein [Gottfriedia acidiceleris]|uniref:hypothetical protein n=1 Tax=Gottfriedia acidiceleris TaxID=371036 RepID=UPI000B437F68|nr:hypothetical protein [Gottfriedia acidiceleris]